MSSLRDIMDVDVEPLESQALRRSKEAAAHQSQNTQPTSSATRSTQTPNGDKKAQSSLKRRRSNRVSKPSSQGSSAQASLGRRRSSVDTVESMESYGGPPGGGGPSGGGSSRVSSRGSNPPESSVRYTPVTGRVSRAKKGQPVHVCELCDPPRTFTRAEHLRRHQLGHQKPSYPCTFEDCEKAFHRSDLLARHLNRHETQGEKAYKAGNLTRSRSSSTSNSGTPPLKVETPMGLDTAIESPLPTTSSSTPHTSASTEGAKTATAFDSIVPGFSAVNFSSPAQDRHSSQLDRSGQPPSRGGQHYGPSGGSAGSGNMTANYSSTHRHRISHGTAFVDMVESGLSQMYSPQDTIFPVTSDGVPSLTLQVPELAFPNSNTSPWYSSSDSTWSTPSEVSQLGSAASRDRSNSVATIADWSNQQSIPWSPGSNGIQTPRTAIFESVPERSESPPYLSPQLSPQMNSFLLSAVVASPTGGYGMELVGTPTLSGSYKPRAQSFSAPRSTNRPKFADVDGKYTAMVDASHLDRSAFGANATPLTKVDDYVKSYFAHLEPIYSISHSETSNLDSHGLIESARAALGSQFHNEPSDREYGSRIHESCAQRLSAQPFKLDCPTMQAIYLTEVFAIFRSKRPDIRFSYQFVEMYKKLFHDSHIDSISRFTRLNSQTVTIWIDEQLDRSIDAGLTLDRYTAIELLWSQWIEYETRQRLRAACFLLDVHHNMCFEQSRIDPYATANNLYLPHPCHQNLWNASSAKEWYNFIMMGDYSAIRLYNPEQLSREAVYELPLSTQCLWLAAVTALLPPKFTAKDDRLTARLLHIISSESPNALGRSSYLSLYHTPVRKLLALTGKTWVLNQKLTNHSEIDALAPTIRKWVTEPSSTHAAWHAYHVLYFALTTAGDIYRTSQWYCIYAATLVIWAFGHRASTIPASNFDRASRDSSTTINATEEVDLVLSSALEFLQSMIELQPQELFAAPRRSDTNAVLDTVRWRLEADALLIHGRPTHAMLLDAVGVLQRLREGGKWF